MSRRTIVTFIAMGVVVGCRQGHEEHDAPSPEPSPSVLPVTAQVGIPPFLEIPNPAPGAIDLFGDQFGYAVAGVGENLLVGALYDDPGGVDSAGSAYLFDGTTGALLLTIPNPAPAPGDAFGNSVAGVGGNLLVGAYGHDPAGVIAAGSVYLFDGATGTLLLTIPNPAPWPNDQFGYSVAGVRGNLLVGAHMDKVGGAEAAGSAFLFDGTTGALLLTIPNPAPALGDSFGRAVAGLGANIVVGAFLDSPGGVYQAGAVYVFDGSSGELLLTIPNPAPDLGDLFGGSVAEVDGNIFVGAPQDAPGGVNNAGSAYLFDGRTGALLLTIPNPAPAESDYFGISVAGVGGALVVGADRDDPGGVNYAGSAYLFDGKTGALLLTIPNPDATEGDAFGFSVAGVGGSVLVGSYGANSGGASGVGFAHLLVNSPPTVPGVSSPADGGSIADAPATLVVTNASDPEGDALTYQFQVDTSLAFAGADVQASPAVAQGGAGTTSWTTGQVAEGTPYYWRARATDGLGISGPWSAPASFEASPDDSGGCGCRLQPTAARSILPRTSLLVALGAWFAARRRRAIPQ